MLLSQHMDLKHVDILATDLDEKILARAREGIYTERALKEVPESLKKRYFSFDQNVYRIDPALKKAITFKKHNLLEDPYPKNYDLIVCRNVMIYFTEEAKHAIYHKFSDALKDQGVFFVGSTEQIFSPERYQFKVIDTFSIKKSIVCRSNRWSSVLLHFCYICLKVRKKRIIYQFITHNSLKVCYINLKITFGGDGL